MSKKADLTNFETQIIAQNVFDSNEDDKEFHVEGFVCIETKKENQQKIHKKQEKRGQDKEEKDDEKLTINDNDNNNNTEIGPEFYEKIWIEINSDLISNIL